MIRFTETLIDRIYTMIEKLLAKPVKLMLSIALITLIVSVAEGQGTGTPNQIRVIVDATNALMVSSAAQTLPLSSPTVFSNTRIRTDASGNLVIADGSGAGFAPANATYITQTANATLTAEQALSSLSTGLMNVTTTTGVVSSIADVAVGQTLISAGTGTIPLWSNALLLNWSALAAGPATAPSAAVSYVNTTAATVGTVAQWSPGPLFQASGWDVDDAVARTTHGYFTLRPISGNTVTQQLQLMLESSPFSGSYSSVFQVNQSGQTTINGAMIVGTSSVIGPNNKSFFKSTADGLAQFVQNSGITVGVELNLGTAAPTVANCSVGTTGTVTTHSSNTAGQINPGSGSTSCDVVFGAPAFSFAPFCTITDNTSVILAPIVSTTSTTGFTVTGLTAGDKFMYHCFGGAI